MRKARAEGLEARQPVMRTMPQKLVSLDETCIKANLTRLHACSPQEERPFDAVPLSHWHSQTFIAGLTYESILAPFVFEWP